ncbi:glycoside hydrolase family 13 protein [Streptobacillus canis]|uniref:glycoside hydrolase family 13 protein n=1 Tax=Streptobacillus canis TaxID=2678686 RepID=UPI0018CC0A81|nr:glycoside hydrolase family 13 protein [Streptobacillus canis]
MINKAGFYHEPVSRYCFAISNNEVVLRLRIAKEDINKKVYLVYGKKYEFYLRREEMELELKFIDAVYGYYEVKLELDDVRLAYIFKIIDGEKEYYYSEDGVTDSYDYSLAYYNFFQVPYINKNDVMPVIDWTRSAVYYQIFVDRFFKGKEKDESYINLKWGNKPKPTSFAGGDLEGIRQKLPYLKELGINVIYLTPIFLAETNHKYDTLNYFEIDPQFGNKEDFKKLVEDIHGMGMRIVLDAVFNHINMNSKKFLDVREKGKDSKYYDWFVIKGDFPDIKKINYECFASVREMPKLNTVNKEVQEFLISVGKYWVEEFDIDGWRLDVADEISYVFWRKFREEIKNIKSDVVLIGENWHDAYPFLKGEQYDGIMNYAFTKAALDYIAKDRTDAEGLTYKLTNILMRNLGQVNIMNMNLLDSHDTVRFITDVEGSKDKLLMALALLFTFVGSPCIYYGTEIMLEGGYDPDCRRCFDWNDKKWDKGYIEKLKKLISLRKEKTMQYGEVKFEVVDDVFKMSRKFDEDEIILLLNMSKVDKNISLENIIISNNYENGLLKNEGFVIYRS